ncbi:unnamed protein product [Penicillium camemberti]|uniref:Str. FM013 n=1 Tax=Penicillium camemberti (strain FM 013) TaxID=1429867 RepID=A0A0G4PMI5_PENC3|nr:unnamed protein product [Penicillium camemberti]
MLRKVRGRFGDKLNPDDAFLSYYDVRLTREDMQTLKNDWLTDNVGLNGETILPAGTYKLICHRSFHSGRSKS